MRFLGADEIGRILRFAVDQGSQLQGDTLTLTLLDVEQIMGEGSLGSADAEPEDARRIKRPAKRSSGQNRGSWDLAQGSYWVTYNERIEIPAAGLLVLQPHVNLLRNGVWHPTLVIRNWDDQMEGMLLTVAARGVKVEENTALSIAHVLVPG